MAGNRLMVLGIQAPAGLSYFTHPQLAYAEIIKITRNVRVLYPTSETPTENFFKHETGLGKVSIDPNNPFNFAMLDETGARIIEKIQIIYKRPAEIYVPPDGPQENQ